MKFRESDITFNFDSTWCILIFDAHPYYRILSGAGLKGVDFIGIREDSELYFFEVKNYSIRNQKYKENPTRKLIEDPELVLDQLFCKVEDTLQAIRVVNKLLLRKWNFRILRHGFEKLPFLKKLYSDWYFWWKVHRIINQQGSLQYWWVMQLEEVPESNEIWLENLAKHLQEAVKEKIQNINIEIYILNKNLKSCPKGLSIKEK